MVHQNSNDGTNINNSVTRLETLSGQKNTICNKTARTKKSNTDGNATMNTGMHRASETGSGVISTRIANEKNTTVNIADHRRQVFSVVDDVLSFMMSNLFLERSRLSPVDRKFAA